MQPVAYSCTDVNFDSDVCNHEMTLNQIHEMVDELYYIDNKDSCINREEFSQQEFNLFSNMSEVQKVLSVQNNRTLFFLNGILHVHNVKVRKS